MTEYATSRQSLLWHADDKHYPDPVRSAMAKRILELEEMCESQSEYIEQLERSQAEAKRVCSEACKCVCGGRNAS